MVDRDKDFESLWCSKLGLVDVVISRGIESLEV